MALIKCPECGAQISDKAAFCPHCGFPMAQPVEPVKKANKRPRKYPKLPNGFGSIKYLSGNRTNPYAVYPSVEKFDLNGNPVQPRAIAYVKDWYTGFGVLSAYNAGTYKPGQEIDFDVSQITDDFILGIISAYNYGSSMRKSDTDMTFEEVYRACIDWDINSALSACTDPTKQRRLNIRKRSMQTAFNNCTALHKLIFKNIRYRDLQAVVDNCSLKHASKELIIVLYHKMYKYAAISDIQKENHSQYVTIKSEDDDTPGVPFTQDELRIIWKHKDNEIMEMIFIMCLTGFRIRAYKDIHINLQDKYIQGGVKTKNGMGRIVPIHPVIYPLIEKRINRLGKLFPYSVTGFRGKMYKELENVGIVKHTPHDCRDTFATLCDAAKVDKSYLKRLLGHSLASDITEDKYIHPSLDCLRSEIDKIDLSPIVTNDL